MAPSHSLSLSLSLSPLFSLKRTTRVQAPITPLLRATNCRTSRRRAAVAPRAATSPDCAVAVDPSTALRVATVNGKSVTAGALSALSVTDASGAAVNLGGKMGEGRAILVMLRHLG
jgi:hypothetical protein